MAFAVFAPWLRFDTRKIETTRTAPERRRGGPVFINDAVTPWRSETLLLTLLRDEALRDQDE